MSESLLVLDVGTTSVKAACFDNKGLLLGSASETYPTLHPYPNWAEQDPHEYWAATIKAVHSLPKRDDIVAIGLSAHMNGALIVDVAGEPLYPHIIHSDVRSTKQCRLLEEIWGREQIYHKTSNPIAAHLSLPKLLWLKENRPSLFHRAAWVLNGKDWIRFKLTGKIGATDFSDASLTGLFNSEQKRWDDEMVSSLGIHLSMLPEVHASTAIAGVLSAEAARLLGLQQGIPVSYGGGDAACATRGALVTTYSEAYAAIGSSAWVSMLSKEPVMDERMRMQHFFDLEGECVNVCGTVQSAGIATDWALGLLSQGQSREELEHQAAEVRPGSSNVLFLPYLMGERTPHWNPYARGAYIGLSPSTDAATLLRATYEGVAFALGECVSIYEELGLPVKKFTLLGGAMRGTLLPAIITNVLGHSVHMHRWPTQATALGAAFAAAIGVGLYKTIEEAIAHVVMQDTILIPDEEMVASYKVYLEHYRCLYPALEQLFKLQNR